MASKRRTLIKKNNNYENNIKINEPNKTPEHIPEINDEGH